MVHASKLLFVLVLGCLLVVSPVFGQAEDGSIAGTVRDSSGALVVGASVAIKNVATGAERTTATGNNGGYSVPGLGPGSYAVKVSRTGFQTFETVVEVTVGGAITADAQLTVGATTTVVEVVAEAGTAVNTQTQEMSQLIDAQQVSMLPSLTRNPYDFVALSGNVSGGDNTTNSANSGQNLTARGVGLSINGQRESGTEILLDGVENVAVFGASIGEDVPVDSIQEYSIITNNFLAEYGRASGGVVNVSSKVGTNAFHGSGWEFNRLSAYTANTYANDSANAASIDGGGSIIDPKGIYTRNQFGFQAGGPIVKNKLFIFESTEWTRVRSSASESEEVLDPSFISLLPANAQAYFASYGTGAAPSSGVATTAGQLSAAGFPVGPINGTTAVAASQPVFDTVNFSAPFDAGGGTPQNTYTLLGRVDYNLTDKTQLFFRAARESQDQFTGSAFYTAYPQYDVGDAIANQSYLISVSHTFTNNVFSNTKISFTRFNSQNSFDGKLTNTPNLMIVSPTDPVSGGYIQLPGLENEGAPGEGGLPFGGPQNTFQPEQDIAWTKGRHNMRFGGGLTYIQLNVAYGAYAQAVEQLGGDFADSIADLTNAAGNPGGSQLVAFDARVNANGVLPCHSDIYGNLIETPQCAVTPPLGSAQYGRSYRYKDWDIYAQDSFRATPRLTINYGLRYEHYGVQHNDIPSLDSNFYYGSGSSFEEQVRNGSMDIADKSPVGQFWAPRWGTAAPRVGFAYDLRGDGKSSIRGGYGISYERNFGNVTYNASFNPPASAVLSSVCAAGSTGCTALVTNDDLGPLGLPGPPSFLGPSELRMPDPRINVAQTQFWSGAYERELTHNTIFEVSYSGARGNHLYDIENINLPGAGQVYLGDPLVTGAACAGTGYENLATGNPECLTRPNNQFSNINMRGSLGASQYNGMNIKFQTTNLKNTGLSLVANYTYARSYDDISSTFSDSLQGGSGYIGSLGYTDFTHPRLDWGPSDFDVRNRVVVSPIWQTPWFRSGKGFARQALGGWTVSGIITARGGIPFSVFDYSNDENFYTVPRLTPASAISQYHVGSPVSAGVNTFNALSVPVPASFAPLNSELGISDFGPFPANMTGRNAFRGPGAWNSDLALSKSFKFTERVGMEFRVEGFDAFNHHNYYVNSTDLYYDGPQTTPLEVTELKGGLGTLATGGNHDERRFGQFSMKLNF
jgi:hypothetical protein